ncbi:MULTISPECIES: hypothetical protein [Olivibacter]|uniref:Uncharacterized protein n=1 Tax=Olivibacter jilunii TaxID=985016 RepID=A0ABW6B009_9SPHI
MKRGGIESDEEQVYIDVQYDYCLRCLEIESDENMSVREKKRQKKNEVKSLNNGEGSQDL